MRDRQPETVFFEGGPQGIILFHAYTGSPNDVRMLGRRLNQVGYSVLMPLFQGHGTMDARNILDANPNLWELDLRKSVDYLTSKGFSEIAVFGLSLGGIYAMKTLELFPEITVGGGAFCSPLVPELKTNIFPSFIDYAEKLLKKQDKPDEEVMTQRTLIKEKLTVQLKEIQRYTEVVYEKLPMISKSIMLVQSGKDELINPQTVYETKKQLVSANAEVYWYPESSHVITVVQEHVKFEEDVLAFVNKLPWLTK